MHEGGVRRGRVTARPDRPDRLGGDDDALQRAAVQAAEGPGQLALHDGQGVASVALGEGLADAQHRGETSRESGRGFSPGVFVRLPEHLAPLGMAHQRGPGARLGGEGRRTRAREGPLRFPVDVLRARQEVFALPHGLGRRFERHRRGEEPYGAVLVAPVAGPERLQVGPGLDRPDMHLPVGGKEEPSHASSRAATPGSGLPSRNSSDAPPPVETWVSLDARPATAAAESPPPTTVVVPRRVASTIASATARVPASNGGCSKTPIGPFHTTVFAWSRRARKSKRVVSSMSNTAQSSGTLSLETSRRSAARSRLGATTAPRGRMSFLPARATTALARSTLSRSTSDPPTPKPRARKNVFAMAPPTRISSTLGNSVSMTSILPEILAPPSTATKGRRGRSSASPR